MSHRRRRRFTVVSVIFVEVAAGRVHRVVAAGHDERMVAALFQFSNDPLVRLDVDQVVLVARVVGVEVIHLRNHRQLNTLSCAAVLIQKVCINFLVLSLMFYFAG